MVDQLVHRVSVQDTQEVHRPTDVQTLRLEAPVFDPRRLWRTLRRQWLWFVLPPLVLGAIGAFSAGLQPSRYQASTTLALRPTAAELLLDGSRSDSGVARELQTEEEVLGGSAFLAVVRATVGPDVDLRADALEGTDLIELTVEADSGASAAESADAIAQLYTDERRLRIEDELSQAQAVIDAEIAELEVQLNEVDASLNTLTDRDPFTPTVVQPDATELAELERLETLLVDRLRTANLAAQELNQEMLLTNGGVRQLAPAVVESDRISPRPLRSGLLWSILGVLVGVGLVWFRDLTDHRIRTPLDVLELTRSLEYAGSVVRPSPLPRSVPAALFFDEVADRLRVLSSSLFNRSGGPVSVQIAALSGGEGSTYLAANLATTLAAGGWRTVLIDADLVGGDAHQIFDLQESPGTTQVLGGDPVASTIQLPERVNGLRVIARGRVRSDATLHNSWLPKMIDGLKSKFDVVIIDGPPILTSGDASVLAGYVDKTVLVAATGQSTSSELEDAMGAVLQGGGQVSAVVLTEAGRARIGKLARPSKPTPGG